MKHVSGTVQIDAPTQRVWEVLADFGNINTFNPGLTASYLTGDDTSGVGATRHCDLTVPGASIEERIVEWKEGEGYRVQIYDGVRNPFATAFATLIVTPVDGDAARSSVSMQLEWKTKGWFLGSLLDRGLRTQNRKAVKGLLAGLKHHIETGDPVAARQRIDVSGVAFD